MKSHFLLLLILYTGISIAQPCLVGHWALDGDAMDQSGNNFHGTVMGPVSASGITGQPGTAYRFDGIDDFISISHNSAFNFDVNDEFSVSLYVKIDDPTQFLSNGSANAILSKWEDNGAGNDDFPYDIRFLNHSHNTDYGHIWAAKRSVNCSQQAKVISQTDVLDSTFHHVLFTRSTDDSIRLYIDGSLEKVIEDFVSCSTTNNLNLEFGRRGGSANPSYFKGVIDEVKIFDCALTPSDLSGVNIEEVGQINNRDLEIYPNPASDQLKIHFESISLPHYEILDMQGRKVSSGKLISNHVEVSELASGIYLMKVITKDEVIETKFVKE